MGLMVSKALDNFHYFFSRIFFNFYCIQFWHSVFLENDPFNLDFSAYFCRIVLSDLLWLLVFPFIQ